MPIRRVLHTWIEIPAIVQQSTIVPRTPWSKKFGVDPRRNLLRAIPQQRLHHCLCEGGSTITQQLAKQIYFEGDDAGPRRKFGMIVLAIQIDSRYSKDDILEYYLNTAYYGHGAYGVGAASQTYWGRPVSKVDLSQAALLAGLPQAPSDYDPIAYPEAARQRRAEVLGRLLRLGLITEAQLQLAAAQPVALSPAPRSGTIAPARASLFAESLTKEEPA